MRILLAVLILVSMSVSLSAEERKRDVVTEKMAREFLQLFHEAKKVAYSGSQVAVVNEAEPFINSCCISIESAVELLVQAEFEPVRYIDDPEWVSHLNRSYQTSRGETYDRFIGSERRAGWWPFWDAFTTYGVTLLIRDNKIEGVSASVTLESL